LEASLGSLVDRPAYRASQFENLRPDISLSTPVISAARGLASTLEITVNSHNGFEGPATIRVNGLPADVSGTFPGRSVTWSLYPSVGTISSTGPTSAVYTAPSAIPAPQQLIVIAKSALDPLREAVMPLDLAPASTPAQ
jgi:hypothetical protein